MDSGPGSQSRIRANRSRVYLAPEWTWYVIPVNTGIQKARSIAVWIPAYAGMTYKPIPSVRAITYKPI